MKKDIRAVVIGLCTALAAFGVLEWKNTIIPIQIGGSQNTQIITTPNAPPAIEVSTSRPIPPVTEREAAPPNTQIEQPTKTTAQRLNRQTPTVEEEEESDCYCDEEDTGSEEADEVEDPAGI